MSAAPRVVVVGAGEAGARAAMALREAGHVGEVVLLGAEAHAPYERPPLSKAAIVDDEPAFPAIAAAADLAGRGVEHRRGATVVAIDRAAGEVALADGGRVPYGRLILATGAEPRRLAIPGGEHALTLRDWGDAARIRRHLAPGARLCVIGAGFIGLELAASARARGCAVSVIEPLPRPLVRAVPAPLAERLAARHRAEGVDLRCGIGVASIAVERDGEPFTIALTDGTTLGADLVVAGIGASPRVELAKAAGLAIDNGIAVDGAMRTSDPRVFAIGDCASYPLALLDGRRVRLESWRNAQQQGERAARAIAGDEPGVAAPSDAVPWFWSDQYDLHLQIAGLPDGAAPFVERPLGDGAIMLLQAAPDGRLLAAAALGPLGAVARDMRIVETLIARRARPDMAALADPATKLKGLLR
ncbi:MAG: FAD-dependent oxidoreductase [Hyphomicrobiales bacterium]|nr:FAD-dependent oxidoreductase [Hyphomicrobiales bacterium]MDE2017387.1 FAD-dependent oxidoreductase [Hyphomicrobiales bacterium]